MNNFSQNIRIFFIKITQNPLFIIKVQRGIATTVSGTVKHSFMHQCMDIIDRNKIQTAIIYGVKSAFESTTIKTFGEISGDILQQLRNVYSFSA